MSIIQRTRGAVRLDMPISIELAYVTQELGMLPFRVPQLQQILICASNMKQSTLIHIVSQSSALAVVKK
jgi:hypothetical protein